MPKTKYNNIDIQKTGWILIGWKYNGSRLKIQLATKSFSLLHKFNMDTSIDYLDVSKGPPNNRFKHRFLEEGNMKNVMFLLLARIIAITFFEIFPIENADLWTNFLLAYLDFIFMVFFDAKCKEFLKKTGNHIINGFKYAWEKWTEFSVYLVDKLLSLVINILSPILDLCKELKQTINSK